MPKCHFNKKCKARWHGCPLVNLLYIFRTPFSKNTYGGLLLALLQRISSNCANLQTWLLFVLFSLFFFMN